jgi:hypothetical protein
LGVPLTKSGNRGTTIDRRIIWILKSLLIFKKNHGEIFQYAGKQDYFIASNLAKITIGIFSLIK